MAKRMRIGPLLGLGLSALLCALLFLVPSSWFIHHGLPRWAAAAIGLLAFPIVPVMWQLVGERRRKRAGVKTALTGRDRFTLRIMVVALIVLGPLFAFDLGGSFALVGRHGAWFLRWGGTGGAAAAVVPGDARLLRHVPADAEAI